MHRRRIARGRRRKLWGGGDGGGIESLEGDGAPISEPQIAHATAVTRQILKAVEPIEVVDQEIANRFRGRESDIDCDAPPTIRLQSQASPGEDAAAGRAE